MASVIAIPVLAMLPYPARPDINFQCIISSLSYPPIIDDTVSPSLFHSCFSPSLIIPPHHARYPIVLCERAISFSLQLSSFSSIPSSLSLATQPICGSICFWANRWHGYYLSIFFSLAVTHSKFHSASTGLIVPPEYTYSIFYVLLHHATMLPLFSSLFRNLFVSQTNKQSGSFFVSLYLLSTYYISFDKQFLSS